MKPPRLIKDVYGDLRDRRLLPLAAVILVAIPAVPLLLGSGATEPPPAPSDPTASLEEEIPTLPAVLASDPGLRDYRKRLDALRSKDPFAQHFAGPNADGSGPGSVADVGSTGSAGGTDALSPTPASSGGGGLDVGTSATSSDSTATTDVASTSSSGTSTSSSASGADSGTGSSSGSGQGSGSGSDGQWFTYRIDVTTGRAGDAEERKDVKRGTVLPSQSNPVALFLGAGEGGKRASFLVSTDVVRTHGEGNCVPSPSDCQILTLKEGHERRFEFAPNGEPDTYVIKLDAIRLVEVDDPKGSKTDSDGKEAQSAHGGLKSFLGL